jgi:hypothetical protein
MRNDTWHFIELFALDALWRQQRQTNDLMEQNNQLLEQIRRMQLTPAQRAREDALRAAEAQLAAERRKQTIRCVLILSAIVFCLVVLGSWTSPSHAAVHAAVEPRATPIVETQSGYAPRAELVRLPQSQ